MAPPQKPKKEISKLKVEVPEVSIHKLKRKRKKKNTESFTRFIFKVLKQVHPDVGISRQGMDVMNSFINDIFERLATESADLIKHNNRKTLSSLEIQTAVRLTLPGELGKHAILEGAKALQNYTQSKS